MNKPSAAAPKRRARSGRRSKRPPSAAAQAATAPHHHVQPELSKRTRLFNQPLFRKWGAALVGLVSFVSAVFGLVAFSPMLMERWRESFPAWTAERSGYLIPQNAQSPSLPSCSTRGDTPARTEDAVLVLLGGNAFWVTKKGSRRPALTLNNKPVVELEYSSKGQIKVWAEIANADGAVLARIGDDLDWSADRRATVYRSASHIVVNDAEGHELFYVRYISEKVLELRGNFYAPGMFGPVVVESTQVRRGSAIYRGNCSRDDAGFDLTHDPTRQ